MYHPVLPNGSSVLVQVKHVINHTQESLFRIAVNGHMSMLTVLSGKLPLDILNGGPLSVLHGGLGALTWCIESTS